MNNIKLKKYLLTLSLISLGINQSGCAKNVECNVDYEHVHVYIDEDKNLEKYILGEKDHKGNYNRTEDYVSLSNELKVVCKNDFLLVCDNIEYINNQMAKYTPYKEAYVYGDHYGYHYGYGYVDGKYGYGWVYGQYYDYDWEKIDACEYTNDKVRDITYNYKLYKIDKETGEIVQKCFDSLDDIDEEYKYFKTSDVINKNISDSYYLEKSKEYKNVR